MKLSASQKKLNFLGFIFSKKKKKIQEFIHNVSAKNDYITKKKAANNTTPEDYSETAHIYEGMWMNIDILVDWLKEHKILDQLYQTKTLHIQLISRCVDIPRFLAQVDQLTKADLDLMWNATVDKHETELHAIFINISELSTSLSLEHINYVYRKIQSIPFQSYDLQTLQLIRGVAASGINQQATIPDDQKKWFGLDLFWQLILDSNNVHPDVHLHGLSTLYDFLNWPPCFSQRIVYALKCLSNVKQNDSVAPSLSLCRKILTTFVPLQSVEKIVVTLNNEVPLLPLIFSTLFDYKSKVNKIIEESPSLDPSKIDLQKHVFTGKQPHFEQLQTRLEYLEFVLIHSSLEMDKNLMNQFWKTMILDVIKPEERDYPLRWLKSLKEFSVSL